MTTPDKAPRLTWASATEISDTLEVSRETTNRMIHAGDFETLHYLDGKRRFFVVDRRELAGVAKARKRSIKKAADEKALKDAS